MSNQKKDFLDANIALEKAEQKRKGKDSVIGLTPAEQGELAAIEEKHNKAAEEEKVRYLMGLKFQKKLDNPEIRVAARKAVLAMDVLHSAGMQITDWSISKSGVEVELEDLEVFEKKWISVGEKK